LLRAESLDDVCSAALDAIERALGCKRSSILLLDDTGVMRFKAWRDLSDNYRRAVEGHSPWAQDVTDPEPICVSDVASAGLEPGLTSVLDAEGLRALAFFPLVSKGALIGKFMTYNEMPHVYGESEVRLALNIARQLAFSVEKMRSEEARRQAENDLHDFFENGSIAMHWVGPDGIILRANRYELRMLGYESHEYIGRPIADFHASLDTIADILQRLSGGEALEGYEAQLRCKDGTIKDVQITSSVLRDSTGRFIHTRCFTQDVSDRKKADETQRLLVGELKHRVKNTLSTIQALAAQTLHSVSAKEKDAFIERLRALSNAHDVIAQSSWHRAPLRDLVRQALEPFQIERIMISGPHVLIDSTKILSLTMSLHELATNAVKYGALSNDLGTVSILWKVREDASGRCVQLFWQESGGPLVSPPTRKGFGSRLLQVSLDAARLEFRPEGLGCALELSLG
jgi:PAS domain S-box-containing protein